MYFYETPDGMVVSNISPEKQPSDWILKKSSDFQDAKITPYHEKLEKKTPYLDQRSSVREAARDKYRQAYQEWIAFGGEDSPLPPPLVPSESVRKLVFAPTILVTVSEQSEIIDQFQILIPDEEFFLSKTKCSQTKGKLLKYAKEYTLDKFEIPKNFKTTYKFGCAPKYVNTRRDIK